jgi:HEAT repeat protein
MPGGLELTDAEIKRATEEQVLSLLRDGPDSVGQERELVKRLIRVGTDASVDVLRARAESPDPGIRAGVAGVLRIINSTASIDALIGILDVSCADAVGRAGRALGYLRVRRAVPDLVRCLESRSSELGADKVGVVFALNRMPDPSATSCLTTAVRDPAAPVRKFAAFGLAAIGTRESRSALATAAADLGRWRGRYARRALSRTSPG